MAKTNKPRADEDYEIEALSKGLAVLESLEGINFEPVSVAVIMTRTGFKRDVVDRSLKTLRLRGYAVQLESGTDAGMWTFGSRFLRLAIAADRHKSGF